MKKNQFSAVLLALVWGVLALPAQATITKSFYKEAGMDAVRFDVTVDGITKVPSAALTRMGRASVKTEGVNLQGVQGYNGVLYKIGSPKIPVVRFLIQGQLSVKADSTTSNYQLEANTVIEPNLAAVVKLPGHHPKVLFDSAAYQSNDFEPRVPYSVTRAGSIRGVPQFLVTLYPVAYQAKTGRVQFRKNFTVIAKRPPNRDRADRVFAFVVGAKFASSPSLQSYAEFKQKQGFKTVIGVMGKDFTSPEQIRGWLQKLLPTGLKDAMIVGDAEDVPAHPAAHISGVTDHYYRAIDTADYEQDLNGPDIGLGRVAVTNEEQLHTVFAKFVRYQSMQRAASWVKNLSFVATDDQYEVAEGTHNYAINTYTAKAGYQGSYPSAASASGGDKLYAITQHAGTGNLVQAFNEGRLIIDYSGHGYDAGWAGPGFTQDNVRSLKNPDALPFVIGNACNTGEFTAAESFGETWLRQPAAAIAYWGSYDSSYWDEDDILERKMFDGIFQNGNRTLGDVTSFGQAGVWAHYGGQGQSAYYWETYVLFGDPSLALAIPARKRF